MLRRFWRRFQELLLQHGPELALAIFFVVFLFVYFAPNMFYSLQPGYYGVLWRRFGGGTDLTRTYNEGLHVILPWNKLYLYDGRLQTVNQDFDVLSSDGLKMVVEITYRFELNPGEIPTLNKYIGPDYEQTLVTPEVGARARDVFSRNTPEEIFSERRSDIEESITTLVQQHLDQAFNPPWRLGGPVHFVKVWDVLIRGITLPPAVAAAIERKNQAKQANEEYDYRLLAEAKEAERKQIEAHGIKEFQDIVAPGLTNNYLRWQGIQSTMALANSPNSKIVVIGGGPGGLPIILGNLDTGPPAAGKPITPQSSGSSVVPELPRLSVAPPTLEGTTMPPPPRPPAAPQPTVPPPLPAHPQTPAGAQP